MTIFRKRSVALALAFLMLFGLFAIEGMEYSYAATKKPSKVTGLSVKKYSSTKVKVAWKKAKNAKKYQVYRKAEGSSSYSCVKTLKSRTYKFTQTPGRKYYYKVRGVNGSKKGSFSSVKGIKINTTNQFIKSNQTKITLTNKNKVTLYFDASFNSTITKKYDSSLVTVSCSDYWSGSKHKIKCVIQAKKSGTSNLKLTVDGVASCTVEIVNILSDRTITSNLNTLTFTNNQTQQIKFTCTNVPTINYSISTIVEITNIVANNGVVTFTIKPISNGVGYIQVSDKEDSSVSCKVPIDVSISNPATKTVIIGTTLPYTTTDNVEKSRFTIEQCDAWVNEGSTSDEVEYTIKGKYSYSPGRYNHYMHASLYDEDGYLISTKQLAINKGSTGDSIRQTESFIVGKGERSNSYKIVFTN